MFVLYLQNSFRKPFQISQIEYSDGASIILNLSSSKKPDKWSQEKPENKNQSIHE